MNRNISDLIYKSIIGKLTTEERAELDAWVKEDEANGRFLSDITDPAALKSERDSRRLIDSSRPAADMQRRIDAIRSRSRNRVLLRAASIAAIIGVAGYFAFNFGWSGLSSDKEPIAEVTEISIADLKPGKASAILSSSEGHSLVLAASESGLETDELLTSPKDKQKEVQDLCLDVPRGGEFKIVLEDSTEVWLNSESQLRYPSTFDKNERRVQVTGEVYFSVKKDPERPFYVESRGQVVKVYGTTFNIKAYPDEEISYTTLETGSISLRQSSGEGGELYLSPGHQAVFNQAEEKVDMKVVNTSVITGWRHGRFVFEEQPLSAIMKDLSRWYDFEYEFSDEALKNVVFMGSIPRYGDFRTAISILEKSGGISFDTSGSKVIISLKKKQ